MQKHVDTNNFRCENNYNTETDTKQKSRSQLGRKCTAEMHRKNANKNVNITDETVTDYVQYNALVNEWTCTETTRAPDCLLWILATDSYNCNANGVDTFTADLHFRTKCLVGDQIRSENRANW